MDRFRLSDLLKANFETDVLKSFAFWKFRNSQIIRHSNFLLSAKRIFVRIIFDSVYFLTRGTDDEKANEGNFLRNVVFRDSTCAVQ